MHANRPEFIPGDFYHIYNRGAHKVYNKRYEHSGTLFEGPYKALKIEQDEHLLHLCRYIHANPVKHGLVSQPENWLYPNYREWINLRSGALIDHAFIVAHFPTPMSYEDFMSDYLMQHEMVESVEKHQ